MVPLLCCKVSNKWIFTLHWLGWCSLQSFNSYLFLSYFHCFFFPTSLLLSIWSMWEKHGGFQKKSLPYCRETFFKKNTFSLLFQGESQYKWWVHNILLPNKVPIQNFVFVFFVHVHPVLHELSLKKWKLRWKFVQACQSNHLASYIFPWLNLSQSNDSWLINTLTLTLPSSFYA